MAVFSPQILNNSPALEVTVQDSGVPPITYAQIKNSLGQYVYLVEAFYVYCTNLSQLIGTINYNRYDSDGNKIVTNIATTVDPYQDNTAIVVDLNQYGTDVVLNGNSSFSTTILPFAEVQLKMYTKRITNSFGRNLENFIIGEWLANRPDFFDNYGNLAAIQKTNEYIQHISLMKGLNGVFGGNLVLGEGNKSWSPEGNKDLPDGGTYVDKQGNVVEVKKEEEEQVINQEQDKVPVVLLSIAAISLAAYLFQKK